jgi:hypothetical protein
MAWNQGPKFRAGGTISPAVFVKMSTTADNTVLEGTANARTIGVSQEGMKRAPGLPGSDDTIAAESGDEIDVFGLGDVCLIEAGAAVVRGDECESNAAGQAIAAAGVGQHLIGGIALESASGINVKFHILVLHYQKTI